MLNSVKQISGNNKYFFTHHPRHLYTLISPDGKTRNQIDHIAISFKWEAVSKTQGHSLGLIVILTISCSNLKIRFI